MLPEALTALAAAGGAAVAQAAGTDAWAGFREGVARWFGRGNPQREHAELERLDRTAGELKTAGPGEAERLRIRQEAAWQARIEARLEDLSESELTTVAGELRALLSGAPAAEVSAGPGGLAVQGDVTVRAEGGPIAAGVVHGGAHIAHPSPPDPTQD